MPWLLFVMCLIMAVGSFAIGMLPLWFVLPKHYVTYLSTLGTGLLVGTALGVTIPEGIEAVIEANSTNDTPTGKIALSLLCGFVAMLFVENFAHSHAAARKPYAALQSASVEFDAELADLELEQGGRSATPRRAEGNGAIARPDPSVVAQAFPLTIGLVFHALADGLALGASFLQKGDHKASDLSIIIFLALIIHKAPTALALTTSLLSSSLSRSECRKHLGAFCASTPLGAVATFFILSLLGPAGSGGASWAGTALLISGGTFLYVATVLQPVSGHSHDGGEMRKLVRVSIIALGMTIPFCLGQFFDPDSAF